MIKKFFLFLFLLVFQAGLGQIKLPGIFGRGMVLQQKSEVQLWGWAEAAPGTPLHVAASWNDTIYYTSINKQGKWQVVLSIPSAGGPHTIVVSAGKDRLELSDIQIGEVWLVSGQSNMQMPMRGMENQPILNSAALIAASDNPKLRLFTVERAMSEHIQEDLSGTWKTAAPENVSEFSAVGYQFGKMLQAELGVPVGIINSSWGGTVIKSWLSSESMEKLSSLKTVQSRVPQKQASVLYNAMIAPLRIFPVAGFLWYQGESDRAYPKFYEKAMPILVDQWRKDWSEEGLPFYYVQIAPWLYPNDKVVHRAPELREAQVQALKHIRNSNMIVTADLGSDKTIHPPDKTSVAYRLFRTALGAHYGREVEFRSSFYSGYEINDNRILIFFENAEGLKLTHSETSNFEIAGADRIFYPASAHIEEGVLVLQSEMVEQPAAARYGYRNYFEGNLYNKAELPASPFRTDSWERE